MSQNVSAAIEQFMEKVKAKNPAQPEFIQAVSEVVESVMPLVRGEVDCLRDPIVIGWADFSTGNAGAHASVRTGKWNYVTATHEDENEQLYDLETDPDENTNLVELHPDLAKELRRRVEAALGQPIPAQMNEVCDPSPAPLSVYLDAKKRAADG